MSPLGNFNKNIKMTEELNLSELFANFVKFISRNSKLLLIIVAIGAVGVIGYQKFKTPYYETKANCTSGISKYERQEQLEDLSQRTAVDLINYLQININNKDYIALSELLGIDPNLAATIKNISAEQLYQQDMNERYYALNKFEISLVVFDNQKIDKIQTGLIYYFENNKYITSYYNLYKQSCSRLLEDIEREMKVLELNITELGSNTVQINGSNSTLRGKNKSLSNEKIALADFREDIISAAAHKPLTFVFPFAKVNQKEDDILVWTLLGAVLSFIFGLFAALIIEVKTK